VRLKIDVYDWQGEDDAHMPPIECPELFDGTVEANFYDDGSGWTRYEAIVDNSKNAPEGTYRCLVGKEAAENNPSTKPWLDLSGYQVVTLQVVQATDLAPVAVAQASKNVAHTNEDVEFDASDSHDTDCDGQSIAKYEWDWNGDGNFVEGPVQTSHSWSLEGTYDVQLRVTDDEGSTDILDTPLSFTVEKPTPVVADIVPQKGGAGADLTGVIISGEDFVGPGASIKLKKIGETDIPASNVTVVDAGQIICNISIPLGAGPGLYDVELENGDGQIAVGVAMFEVAVDVPNSPVDITPPWLNFSPEDICVDGNFAYIAGGTNGFHIFDISNPANPVWVGRVPTPGNVFAVTVANGFAYALDETAGLLIIDIGVPGSASIVNQVEMPSPAFDVAVSGDYAYVTINMQGLAVVDINPPEDAAIVSSIFVDIGPDFRVENVAVQGDYAYVTVHEMTDLYYDDYWHLVVVDIHSPTEPFVVDSVSGEGDPSGLALTGNRAYVLVNNGFFDGEKISFYITLGVVDIDSPEAPVILPSGLYWDGRGTSIQVSGTTAFIAIREASFCIFDVSTPDNIPLINSVPVAKNSTSAALGAGAEYAFLAGDAGLISIDISPPESAYLLNTAYTPGSPSCLALSNNLVFVGNVYGGIQIVDPAFPGGASVIKGFAEETVGTIQHLAVDNGYAFADDQFEDEFGQAASDLRIFDVDPPESASQIKWSGTSMGDIAVSSGYAYVAVKNLVILDVDPPENTSVINTMTDITGAEAVAVDGAYAYVTDNAIGLIIVDISQPDTASVVKTVPIFSLSYSLDVEDGYAYMISNVGYSLSVVDVNPPEDAALVGNLDLPGSVSDIDVSGGYAYVTTYWLTNQPSALHIVDISDPTAPYLLTSVDLPGRGAQKVAVQGDTAYVTYTDGLMIMKLW
jgi:hypothetical protein